MKRRTALYCIASSVAALLAASPALAEDAATEAAQAAPAAETRPMVVVTTTEGDLTIELYPDKAPETVANFLELAQSGFYEGLVFHRVIAGFMIQAGGYDTELNYRTPPRQVVNESDNGLLNRRWSVAMARHADPDSAGSQFYVNVADNPHLDPTPDGPGYTVFGALVGGFDVAETIELADTGLAKGMPTVPVTPIVLIRMHPIL